MQQSPNYRFLLSRLVKRDFIQRYKKTTLGVVWSILSPLCEFAIMMLVFKNIFGRDTPHYTTYILSGLLLYNYYGNATTSGMTSLLSNAGILNKIKLPTWLFPLSKTISATINFLITCVVLVVFMIIDDITFSWQFVFLLYPAILFFLFNLGVSFLLASLYVFFKDVSYLYSIFNRLVFYCSAIFWKASSLGTVGQSLLHINPIYNFIYYVRSILIDGCIPSNEVHLLLLAQTGILLLIGWTVYTCSKDKFIFYL